MLKQTQKKIMSVKDFTNRLTFLSNAIEACARTYDNDIPAGKVKRRETREGFGMLVFLPPKPSDDHMKLHDNIVCHWHYRNVLANLQEQEKTASEALEVAQDAVDQAQEKANSAGESYSQSKQSLNNPTAETESLVEAARLEHEACKAVLAEERTARSTKRNELEAIQKKISSCRKELDKLWKERSKQAKGKEFGQDYARLAKDVMAFNGVPIEHLDFDPHDPACFDGIVDLPCRPKEATPTDISRLRTDSSNSTILNEFVISNMIVSPRFSDAGFPACRSSLVRDTDPEFEEAIIATCRKRVRSLVLEPELEFGEYSPDEQALLAQTLGAANLPRPKRLGIVSSPRIERAKESCEGESNILYEVITSDAFPVMVEEMLKPAVMEGLARFGGENSREDFARKLAVLAFSEQEAREKHAKACDRLDASSVENYAKRLQARCEIIAFMLSVSLLGSTAVEDYEVDMSKVRALLTGKPNLRPRAQTKCRPKAQTLIVEQIPNADGSFSFGKSFTLAEGRSVLIGRAPFDDAFEHVIVPAGCTPYPGLLDFAANVSRSHALVEPSEGDWYLSDAGSSYGTAVKRSQGSEKSSQTTLLIDDERVLLQNGDVIVLAPRESNGGYEADPELGFAYRFEVLD